MKGKQKVFVKITFLISTQIWKENVTTILLCFGLISQFLLGYRETFDTLIF